MAESASWDVVGILQSLVVDEVSMLWEDWRKEECDADVVGGAKCRIQNHRHPLLRLVQEEDASKFLLPLLRRKIHSPLLLLAPAVHVVSSASFPFRS